jgi:chromosome segregation ATPase
VDEDKLAEISRSKKVSWWLSTMKEILQKNESLNGLRACSFLENGAHLGWNDGFPAGYRLASQESAALKAELAQRHINAKDLDMALNSCDMMHIVVETVEKERDALREQIAQLEAKISHGVFIVGDLKCKIAGLNTEVVDLYKEVQNQKERGDRQRDLRHEVEAFRDTLQKRVDELTTFAQIIQEDEIWPGERDTKHGRLAKNVLNGMPLEEGHCLIPMEDWRAMKERVEQLEGLLHRASASNSLGMLHEPGGQLWPDIEKALKK